MINLGNLLNYALPIAKEVLPAVLKYTDDYGACSERVGDMRPALPINGGNIDVAMQKPLEVAKAITSVTDNSNKPSVAFTTSPKILVKANIEVYVSNDGTTYEKANEVSFDKTFAFSDGTMSAF